jgi:uncharacterized protein (DUF1810 family)
MINHNDADGLNRFEKAQESMYDLALSELKLGKKKSHWMWYIFPQLAGLGLSTTAKYYAIKSLAETQQYSNHPVLGPRLLECAEALLALEGQSISDILGYPDDLKLKSSMTLFSRVAEPHSVFIRVLDKYFDGKPDDRTLALLEQANKRPK